MSEWYFLIHAYFASTNSLQYLIRWSRSACDPCWFSMDLQMKLHCSSWLHVWPRGAPPICGTHCDICIQRSDFVSRTLQRLTCQVGKVHCFLQRVKAGELRMSSYVWFVLICPSASILFQFISWLFHTFGILFGMRPVRWIAISGEGAAEAVQRGSTLGGNWRWDLSIAAQLPCKAWAQSYCQPWSLWVED